MSNPDGTYSFDGAEAWLRATVSEELGAWQIAHDASEALSTALHGTTILPEAEPQRPSYFVRSALLLLATMGPSHGPGGADRDREWLGA